jgi:hypothetical protein
MNLDYDKVVRLGQTIGTVINSEAFEAAVEVIQTEIRNGILQSQPHAAEAREALYTEYKCFEKLVSTLKSFVAAAEYDAQQAELSFGDDDEFIVID